MLRLVVRKTLKYAQRGIVAAIMLLYWRGARRAFLYGTNDSEENLLALALALSSRYSGRVYLLSNDPASSRTYLGLVSQASGLSASRVRVVSPRLLRDVFLFGSSELVFGTHFRFSGPPWIGRRIIVNVFHGTGPKRAANVSSGATVLCACATAWLPGQATSQSMPKRTDYLLGNPRQDFMALTEGVRGKLEHLGISSSLPVVAWMPTYRGSSRAAFHGSVQEGVNIDNSRDAVEFASELKSAAELFGAQLVVKPHPMDDTDFSALGLKVVTSEQLWASGVSLYQFLGCVDGLISDYSSVWVDFLQVQRSVGFYIHDESEFESSRGYEPGIDLGSATAELRLRERADIDDMMRAVGEGRVFRQECLERLTAAIGYRFASNRADRLLAELCALGYRRHNYGFGLTARAER